MISASSLIQPTRHKIKSGSVRLFIPTVRASLEEVTVGNVKFKAWDLGGHKQVRGAWRDYFAEADAIIFVVDAADHERLNEAQEVHDTYRFSRNILILSVEGITKCVR